MRLIKCLAAQMKDELCGAKEYVILALEHQKERPQLANLYYQMAQTEYQHYKSLHDQTTSIIDEIDKINVPNDMVDSWERKHKKLISKAAEVQIYMNMYK